MHVLEKELRSQLERTVREARDVAEGAAAIALQQLGVGEAEPFSHSNEMDRELRRRLRAHGRQLGDALNGGKVQFMDRLVEEVAYEHWHRMLFARFLAENNLLMYPDPNNPVPISLEECEDLAVKEGAKNGWELAARFAERMLPQIFRVDSPVFQLVLPPEYQQKLERFVSKLPVEVFFASDSLGWVYQYWQANKKEAVNASEAKIGARELPAVTQVFTEPYMVSFLLDNSLGAWWAAHKLTKNDLTAAKNEEELRRSASLPGVPLEYLRFVRGESGLWTPATGTFEGWPKHLSELKIIDPCCGSGHFLVAAFLMLVPMRMELERLCASDAVAAVLRDNLNGLEIDQRCVELAAFAVAFAAWSFSGAGGYRQLPELNIACSGLSISAKKEDWLTIAGDESNIRYSLGHLHDQFKSAPILGSLINPEISLGKGTLLELNWDFVAPMLTQALSREQNYEKKEMEVVAHGLSRAAQLLVSKYHLVITNVPYLSRSKQNDTLREYCERQHPLGKNDLATVFLDRCLQLSHVNGTCSIVMPQNWLFLNSYSKLREQVLMNETLHLIARLGPQAFQTPMWDFNVQLIILSRGRASGLAANWNKEVKSNLMRGLDISIFRNAAEKAIHLSTAEIKQVEQSKQLKNPAFSIELDNMAEIIRVSDYAFVRGGITTGDSPQYRRSFWEQPMRHEYWSYQQSTMKGESEFSGRELVILWEKGSGKLFYDSQHAGATIAGRDAWGKKGIAINYTGKLRCSLYIGDIFENIICVMIPKEEKYLLPLWAFCSSNKFEEAVRTVNQKLSVDVGYFEKAPFDLSYWIKVSAEKYPNGLPEPYSDDLTQWIFHGHPSKSHASLQVVVARLLGYRWPAELDNKMELSEEAREWVKKSESLLKYADADGIVCIPSVRGEMKAEDRLENLLAAAYGVNWSSNKKSDLLSQVGYAGKTLESWLREKFFTQHCKLFNDRPFVWHIWDGLSDGFAALVNYHKLDAKKLETLIYTYLGDWISRQKQDIANGVDGAEEKLAAAETLKKRLELILEGEAPYDIFVRWKSLEKQSVGWNPDLNDGVRLNIRPFMSVPDVGKKGAGVLRDKPNIKWDKDRGKDAEWAPWYRLFKGERINDHHLTLARKRNQ